MRVGNISQSIGQNCFNGGWQLIHEKLFDAAATSYTISGLDGDNDEEYELILRATEGSGIESAYCLRLNGDSVDGHYGRQGLYGRDDTTTAFRDTTSYMEIGTAEPSQICLSTTILYVKSGYIRTAISKLARKIAGTTVGNIFIVGNSWNNTADNITSLVILANQTNGLGVGSHIFLFKRQKLGSEATTGMRVGKQELQGKLNIGTFQKIFSHEVTDADSYTKLLLHMDDAALSDATGKTVTKVGTAALSIVQKKFGIGSCLLDGDSDYLTLADSDDWNFGSGNFTIDCWVRFASVATGSNHLICGQYYDTFNRWSFNLDDANKLEIGFTTGGDSQGFFRMTSTWSMTANTLYHVAVVRNGATCKIFIDGVSQTITEIVAFTDGSVDIGSTLRVGGGISSGYWNGWIDELRISKGIARWTEDFTPPTEPYTSKLTSLLIDGLDGDNDEEYKIVCRFIGNTDGTWLYLRLNNDSGSNYGSQVMYGINASVGAYRETVSSIDLGDSKSLITCLIYAKSGYVRTILKENMTSTTGTTVTKLFLTGHSWNNTVDNLTSLLLASLDVANGICAGTVIELFALRKS